MPNEKKKDTRKGQSFKPNENVLGMSKWLKQATGLSLVRIYENALELYVEKVKDDGGIKLKADANAK
jgi:hypothetical protein